jgi:membrane fusion protein (multidrug efflux system)
MTEQEYFSLSKKVNAPASDDQNPVQEGFEAQLTLGNGETFPEKGTFIFADRQIDTGTGTILAAVSFPNSGNVLRPGQFGRVRAVMSVKKNALLVPQRAITELQGSYQVAVVEPDNKVTIKAVKVAETVGSLCVIDEGLSASDRVVVEGLQSIKDGSMVNPTVITAQAQGDTPLEKQGTVPLKN